MAPSISSILSIIVCAFIALRLVTLPRSRLKTGLEVAFGLLCLLIGFDVMGNVGRLALSWADFSKSGSVPYAPIVSFGLVLVGALLVFVHAVETRHRAKGLGVWNSIRLGAGIGMATAIPALALAYALGGITWQPGLPRVEAVLGWVIVQATVVTVEEAFFRGLLQRRLGEVLGVWYAVPITALLFGVAHAAGGATWVVAATVAGIGYGLAYHLSGGRLIASMSAHIALNTLHLALWTYPTVL